MTSSILVTGCAGFIGFNLTNQLLDKKIRVVGIDNFSSNSEKKIKFHRCKLLKNHRNKKYFKFEKIDINNESLLKKLFKKYKFKKIIHLAALAGVRNSFLKPKGYIDTNIIGSFNILEKTKQFNVPHIIIASTSSVYGQKEKFPVKEMDETNKPISIYAATKKSMEVISYVYSHNFNIKVTILRFFTVYGPYGRPDMALYNFVKNCKKNKFINLFNKGNHKRDFTYITDTISAIESVIFSKKKYSKFEIFNVSNGKSIELKKYVSEIEKNFKKKIKKRLLNMQQGDVHKTHGSNLKFKKYFSYKPKVSVSEGVKKFIEWFQTYEKK